jgi:hypothetical protein
VILIGLQYPRSFLFALALLVFFSIGLGSVLVGIGVALVTGKALLASRVQGGAFFQKLLKVLPILSALFIAGLGAFFCANAFATGRTQIAAMLHALADWVTQK